jgi:hypothetical protein
LFVEVVQDRWQALGEHLAAHSTKEPGHEDSFDAMKASVVEHDASAARDGFDAW